MIEYQVKGFRPPSTKQKFKWTLLGLCALLLASEICLRVIGFGNPPLALLDPDIEYYAMPNQQFSRWGNTIITNRYGMRSEDFDRSQQVDFAIAFFGDSIVYGNHHLDQNETIAAQFKQTIRHLTSTRVSAIAASSWGPQNILAYYKKFGPFPGNIAIVVQSSHDRYDVPFTSPYIIPYQTQRRLFATTDFLYTVIEHTRLRLGLQGATNQRSIEERTREANTSLNILIATLKQDFDTVVLVHHAQKNELSNLANESELYFQNVATEHKIDFISTREHYLEANQNTPLFRDHIHLTASGVRVFNQLIKSHDAVKIKLGNLP